MVLVYLSLQPFYHPRTSTLVLQVCLGAIGEMKSGQIREGSFLQIYEGKIFPTSRKGAQW